MRVFICTDHDCVWPVGVCSIVVANDESEARALLSEKLVADGLNPNKPPFTLRAIDTTKAAAEILLDGQY